MNKLFLLIAFLACLTAKGQTNQYLSSLQAGLLEEEVNRNLDTAITIYSNLVTQADTDRAIFANALFRLAETYRKKGQTNKAATAYEKLLNQYPDQPSLTSLARTNGQRQLFLPAATIIIPHLNHFH